MLYTNLNEIKDKSQILNAYANDQNPLSILTSYFYGLAVKNSLFYGLLQKKFPESLK